MKHITRRSLTHGLIGLAAKAERRIEGGFVDGSHLRGHLLRDRANVPQSPRREKIPVVIVGGGIAGLGCAWRLAKRGFSDFAVLEMESRAGGNSRWGENEVSAFPWAAHYLPVPSPKSADVWELCREFGLIIGGAFDERHLCHSPQERLYIHGKWQEGVEPYVAATPRDREHFRRFRDLVERARATGEFSIPMSRGKRRTPGLDRISMAQWLDRERLDSPYLRWYVDYACRDDYGARAASASAWAGLHYFAAREHGEEKGPLTWPEGNGWLVKKLLQRVGSRVRTGEMVHAVLREGSVWTVHTEKGRIEAKAVVFAAPSFLAPYLIDPAPKVEGFVYSPWLTANLTLDRWPREGETPVCWDNVIYQSPALGYVVATHQSLRTRIGKTVWTYYWALADLQPAEARRQLLARDWNSWKEAILADLEQAHPDIRECVRRVDIMRQGHAMIRPTPGFLASESRARLARGQGTLLFANSDVSGLSLFEEALDQGYRAADRLLGML